MPFRFEAATLRANSLALYVAVGRYFSAWARAKLGDPMTGIPEVRQALRAVIELGAKTIALQFMGLLAEIEAEVGDGDGALAQIDEALAFAA